MTPQSIALCCNVYNDAVAVRGLLESGARYFDNLFIIHSGPGGAYSTDGTIEACQEFGATVVFDDIQRGYGHIRTRLIHDCGCSWAFILDADERFFPQIPVIHCEGVEHYPEHPNPNLSVFHKEEICNQGALVRQMMQSPDCMAIRTTRRHWFDFAMRRASQNFLHNKDHQLRIVRNIPEIRYRTERVMHEQLIDTRTGSSPGFAQQSDYGGPFHDHFHLVFRRTEPGKKEFNEQNYSRLERGEKMLLHEGKPMPSSI